MRRLHILCEGQTEENVVRECVAPYFDVPGRICTTMSLLTTRRPASGAAHKGGVTTWAKLEREIRRLLGDSSLSVLTTLIDYYGLPSDAPGMDSRPAGAPGRRVEHVERALAEEIADPRFLPHLVLHETETWVLAGPEALELLTEDLKLAGEVRAAVAAVGGAELVNDGSQTAPSKRLETLWPGYRKTAHGPDAIALTGITEIRRRCPHADAWFAEVAARLDRE